MVNGEVHVPASLYPRKFPSVHWMWGWVGPRVRLFAVEKVLYLIHYTD